MTKSDRGQSIIDDMEAQKRTIAIMRSDLADKQHEFQNAKNERAAFEQHVWETDDKLKATKINLLKDEQRLNEIVRDYEHRVDDLRYND